MDIQAYLQDVDRNSEAIWAIADACSDTTLRAKNESKWSILEILEHIFLTDKLVRRMLSRPSENTHSEASVLGNEKIKRIMVDGSNNKAAAPDLLHPKGNFPDLATLKQMMMTERNLLKENILSQQIIIDNRIHRHPFIGEMTISDWLYFIIHHSERHLNQIKALIAEQKP